MTEIQRRRPPQGHFTEEAWADFVRGQGEPEQRAHLERHLDSGCEPCAETLGVWTAVVGLAGQEASYQPPDGVVARMKSQFALSRPEGLIERAARSASLIFDSFRQPALAGVRAAGASPRHLLYKAGRYLIRLQVEREAGSDRLSVVGQIVDEVNPKNALQELPVLLLNDKDTLDRTVTNILGEFQLEADPSKNLRLSVGIPEIGTLTLPGLLAGAGGLDGADVPGMRGGLGRRTRARHP
jgi:hypothetical protein